MSTDTTVTNEPASPSKPLGWKMIGLIGLPVIALVGVIVVFLVTDGAGLHVEPAAPIETVSFEQTILHPGMIEFTIRNTSPQPITIAAININDAIWPFTATPGATIPRLGQATFKLEYHWVRGEAYQATFFSTNSIAFNTSIPVAAETVMPTSRTLLSYLLIGLYVGVIPVFLGMFWLPALKRLGPRWMMFLMAITAGLLIFLGIDATHEGLELAGEIGGAFQGVGLVGIGIVLTFLLLDALSRRQTPIGRSEANQRLALAFMIALGIGLHNLGEGLAIGASFSQGALALGTFLVIGFIIQNITEGLGIVIPVLKDRPSLRTLALLGLLGGGPTILGGLIGGLLYSKVLAVLFLAVGAGAVFEVVYEVAKLIRRDSAKRPMPLTVFAGVATGMLALYIMGLFVK
ncbi:MAG TPA: ZIP family metal transporter [Aggregatilineaceae bacterium]|nr:ZIP family metal transporter [Aggregatilineaceae bacterium]